MYNGVIGLPVRIRLVDGSREWVIEDASGLEAGEALRRVGLLSEEYIIVRNGEVITPNEKLRDGDEIVLYPVVSGG